jgi:hypothetical protein
VQKVPFPQLRQYRHEVAAGVSAAPHKTLRNRLSGLCQTPRHGGDMPGRLVAAEARHAAAFSRQKSARSFANTSALEKEAHATPRRARGKPDARYTLAAEAFTGQAAVKVQGRYAAIARTDATNPALSCGPGLLRGACHRAGIRPTRRLAMTCDAQIAQATADTIYAF